MPAAGAEEQAGAAGGLPVDPEGADADGQLGRALVGVDPADAAAVGAARGGLQCLDDPQGGGLRGARDGAGREGGGEQLGPARTLGELPADGGDEVDQAGVLLHGAQLGHGDGAGGADPAEVVAYEVHDHHVLGVVLGEQVGDGAAGALDGARCDVAAGAAQVELGGGGGDLDAVSREPNRSCIGRRITARKQGGECVDIGAGRVGQRRGHHPAEIGLVDLTCGDVLADAPYAGRVGGPVERGGPLVGVGAAPGPGDG